MTTTTPTDGDDEQPPQCVQWPPNGHHLTFVTSHQHLGKEGMVVTEEQGYGYGWGSQHEDRQGIWFMVGARDLGMFLYICFLNYLNFFYRYIKLFPPTPCTPFFVRLATLQYIFYFYIPYHNAYFFHRVLDAAWLRRIWTPKSTVRSWWWGTVCVC